MVYHSRFVDTNVQQACSCAVLPLRDSKGAQDETHAPDVVDEALDFFRPNMLFHNFQVQGPADKLLLYLTLYLNLCLRRLVSAKAGQQEGQRLLFSLAHGQFALPGDAGFVLGGLMAAAATKDEEEALRRYLRQCRQEAGRRLLQRCYTPDGTLDKFWTAFANRRFLNLALDS